MLPGLASLRSISILCWVCMHAHTLRGQGEQGETGSKGSRHGSHPSKTNVVAV
jgi:hypothetical protein